MGYLDMTNEMSFEYGNKTLVTDHIMIWVSCNLCFFGFLRSGKNHRPLGQRYDTGAYVSFSDFAINDHSNSSDVDPD